jgi:UDP-2,3-diacylglucosamine pyrophosphatase LpxH
MDAPVHDTLILSDVHLGAEISRARAALSMLKENSFRRLILLGDIFADLNFGRLKKEHWQFLGLIRKLSNPKRKIEVVWVEGNHDLGLTNVMSHLVGVRVFQQYEWEYAGLRHLAIHGHQFDGFAVNSVSLSSLGTNFFLALQKLDLKGNPMSRLIDRWNTRFLRMSSKVAGGALEYARQHHADRIFCGHTHQALHETRDGVDYYNSGGWIDSKLTYITVGEDGVRIHEYKEPEHADEHTERADDHHSGEKRSEADSESADFADEAGLFEDAEYEGVGR